MGLALENQVLHPLDALSLDYQLNMLTKLKYKYLDYSINPVSTARCILIKHLGGSIFILLRMASLINTKVSFSLQGMCVVYFDLPLGAAHSKLWFKSAFSMFFLTKCCKKEEKQENGWQRFLDVSVVYFNQLSGACST